METASRFIIAFVLNAAWQLPLLALAAAAGGRLLPSASARHRLFLAAIGLSLVVPAVGAAGAPSRMAAPANPGPAMAAGGNVSVGKGWLDGTPTRSVSPAPRVAGSVVAAYLGFLALAIGRGGRAWRRTDGLRRAAGAAPPEPVRRVAEDCRRRLGVGDVEVRLSTEVGSPVTLGARRPLILLPEALAVSLGPEALIAALGHEMAHVCRRDFAWNAAAELASWPIAFHPAAAWLRRRLREERELACDALVAGRLLEPRAYARSLADLARALAPAPALSLGVADAGILEERVMSLVTGRARRKAGALPSFAAALMLVAASVLGASHAVAVETGSVAADVVGSWTGHVDEMGDVPAVDLKIGEKDEHLSGSVTFYAVRVGPQGPTVTGKDVVEMLEPRLEGKQLGFKLKNPKGETVAMVLKLTGKDEGELTTRGVTSDGGANPASGELVVKMKRSK